MKKKISLFLLLLAAAAATVYIVFGCVLLKYDRDATRVNIPLGANDSEVRTILSRSLGHDFGSKTYALWKLQKGSPATAHGSYLVNKGDEAFSVARKIAKGRQTPVQLTFNNMRRVGDLAARAAATLELDSAAFMAAADSVLTARGLAEALWPAAFIPDTYEFYWTVSPRKLIATLADNTARFWNDTRRNKAKELGLTPEEAATLASIVEEETNRPSEYGKVGRLYINRYRSGMPLQADPTVKFALGDFGLRRITLAHTQTDSPYNTYRRQGLPPGPIRIAAAATVDSILNSRPHNFLYMCASPDFSGYHVFARTYDEHRINAARYHRALNARNIN